MMLINVIKRKLLAILCRIRLASLDAWLQARVATLQLPVEDEAEQASLSSLSRTLALAVANGTVAESDLKIAAMIASGKHRANRVVNALLQSFSTFRLLSCRAIVWFAKSEGVCATEFPSVSYFLKGTQQKS